jgi:DNA-binding CsgD family transcriptional regulator
MERLTKTELRTLLECIKECYPICDLESFAQRVVSRRSKIVSTEIVISYRGVNPRRGRNAHAAYLPRAYRHYENITFHQRVHERKTRDSGQGRRVRLHNAFHRGTDVKCQIAPRLINHGGLNHTSKDFGPRKKLFIKLLSPHRNQAYRNAQTFTHMQQKLTLVDQALDRLHLGIIVLTADRKVRLATASAVKQVTNYLGHQCLRGNRLPEPLRTWIKQQEVVVKEKGDVVLQRNPLVLAREGKRLVIRFVSDLDQSLLLLEEHPTTMQLQSLVPFGLSPREAQVLDWVAQGKTNKEIGVILDLSPRTVQKHLEHIYRKIYVETRTAAAAKAYEMALLAKNSTAN